MNEKKRLENRMIRLAANRMLIALKNGDVQMAEDAYNTALLFERDNELLAQGYILCKTMTNIEKSKWKRIVKRYVEKDEEEPLPVYKPCEWKFS